MRAVVIFWTMIAVLAGTVCVANVPPTVTVGTDEASYVSGDTIEVSLGAENTDAGMAVDLYFGLLGHDGGIYTLGPGGWSTSLAPWIGDVYVPSPFAMTVSLWIDVPSEMPPIGEPGQYCFAALLAQPGTFNWLTDLRLAPFSISEWQSGITMVPIPAGSFLMGSLEGELGRMAKEGPQRTVSISAFEMSETEITQRQWSDMMGWNDSSCSGDDHPVEEVTWFDCVYFCNVLSEMEGLTKCYTMTNLEYEGLHIVGGEVECNFGNGYRLATEAEWEYACRAGTTTRFYSGDADADLDRAGWYEGNMGSCTQAVKQKEANGWGLYDMHGNVWEWCWDWFDEDYYASRPDPDSDPTGPSSGLERASRSGGWGTPARYCRSANRNCGDPSHHSIYQGFRIVKSATFSREITMLSIPSGSFLMGSPTGEIGRMADEGPQRTVNISAFEMSETEVTQGQWIDVLGWNESHFGGYNHPVEHVTWYDCVSFCNRLSQAEGYPICYTMASVVYNGEHIISAEVTCNFDANGYRLPTEAEWEYACRAGTTTRFHSGDSDSDLVVAGWCSLNSGSTTHSVGEKAPNSYGLYDMHGNVWEWCWDRYDMEYYGTQPNPDTDPKGPSSGLNRVARGGSWMDDAEYCRSAYRTRYNEAHPYYDVGGFRVVKSE